MLKFLKIASALLLSLVICNLVIMPTPALAQAGREGFQGQDELNNDPMELPNPLGSTNTLTQLLDKILDGLLVLSIPIMTIMVLYGAFMIMSSASNPGKVETGKKTVLYAAIGFGIFLFAKVIAIIIRSVLGG